MCEGEHDRTQAPRHVLRDDGTAAVRAQGVVVLIPGVLLPFLVLIGADRELAGGIELRDRDVCGNVLPREHPARSVRRARPGTSPSTIVLRRIPSPSTSTSTTSPGSTGRECAGVPDKMTSPGSSVIVRARSVIR